MGRKIWVAFAVVLFSVFVLANSAFAVQPSFYIHMTYNDGNTEDVVTTFGWEQQPYLYIHLPSEARTYTISWWDPPGGELFYDCFKVTIGEDEVWHTLGDWFDDPDGSRQLGLWNVRADYSSFTGSGSDTTSFTVTPEPLSSVLFLIGGISLAAFGRKKLRRRS